MMFGFPSDLYHDWLSPPFRQEEFAGVTAAYMQGNNRSLVGVENKAEEPL